MNANQFAVSVASILTLALVQPAFASDPFEGGPGDNSAAVTTNELNIDQVHDLEAVGGVADQDWFIVFCGQRRSCEVRVFSESGTPDFSVANALTIWNFDGSVQLGTATGTRALAIIRWINNTDQNGSFRFRVTTGQTNLTPGSYYNIGFRETTMYCPRYNNTGTQTSVLILQHVRGTSATCNVDVSYYNQDNGARVATSSHTLSENNMLVLPTINSAGATRGHARVAHTCGNGGLKGKLVALEPATGFSFDTLCEQR